MDAFMIGALIFFAFILGARYLNEQTTRKLSPEKKAELVDLFSKSRAMNYIVILGTLALYFVGIKTRVVELWILMGVYFVVLLGYIMVLALNTLRKLETHGFPKEYIKSYVYATILRIVGVILFMAIVMF